MSAKATFWAWQQDIKPATAKLVLLCLADCHSDETGRCNPSILHIAKTTGLDRKTVITSLSILESIGAFVAIKNYGSWTQYKLQTSTKNGTGMPEATSPNNGTGKAVPVPKTVQVQPVPKTVQVEQKPVPKTVQVSPDQSQKRDTNLKHKRIRDKTLCPDHLKMAEWIWVKVQSVTQSTKTPNLEAWADDVRKLNEIDKRDLRLIGEVFLWAHTDQFWKTNILSPAKLRDKFDALYAKFEGARHATHQPGIKTGQAQPRLTPAQRTAAKREALRSQSPALGVVATDGGGLRPPVGITAG